uniref:TonB C-terminal domain-containing protein n=1 Tax=Oscillatoriales cyanobacterium SpSt-402 TaxID=2282168 RepID=A0A832H5D3_9CYAN
MSNFSPLKNVPPILQNQSAETLWKTLRQPFSLAVLASLGVHTLLWFGLPLLPSSSAKQPEQRTLSVVELSPLEQAARLPQTSPNQPFNLSPKPDSSKPSDATSSSVPMVPLDPTLTDPSTYYQIPDTSTGESSTFSDRSSTSTTRTKQEKPDKTLSGTKQTETQTAKNDDSGDSSDSGETQSQDASSNRADKLNSPDGKGYSKSRDDQEKLAALQQLFAYNAAGTSTQDITDSMKAAGEKIAEKFNVRDWEKPVVARVAYPKEACQFQHEGKPIQGTTGLVVVLQPDGTLSDTALMLKSSGFKGLDDTARQFVEKQWGELAKQNNIEPGKNPKAFPLELKFEPAEGECAGVTKPVS